MDNIKDFADELEKSLKPCPFCKGKGMFAFTAKHSVGVTVKCTECGAGTKVFWIAKKRGGAEGAYKLASEAWNTRC